MKKGSIIERTIQAIATVILIVLIFLMMLYVKKIQGTARVVNYAGLVRGQTQRMVKLEIAGKNQEEEIKVLDRYVDGIANGSRPLNLIYISDQDYQDKVTVLQGAWNLLKEEIAKGQENSAQIISISEEYFQLSDELVSQAELYSQNCATAISRIEIGINVSVIVIMILLLRESIVALHVMKANHALKEQVYIDEWTGLPNRAACEDELNDSRLIKGKVCCMMFDLNNLKYVNDTLGHDAGDQLIAQFAEMIRKGISEEYFVGRYGGDEFIVIAKYQSEQEISAMLEKVRKGIDEKNESDVYLKISYAVGYARSDEFEDCTLRVLLSKADRRMYANKRQTKKQALDAKEQTDRALSQLVAALGRNYKECCYCNAVTERFRCIGNETDQRIPREGRVEEIGKFLLSNGVDKEYQQIVKESFDLKYVKSHINTENRSYSLNWHCSREEGSSWWMATFLYGDSDESDDLQHFIIVFQENTQEMKLEYEAKHDGLTGLWNKTTAMEKIDKIFCDKSCGRCAMFVIDLDNFKHINDRYGHEEGDLVLKLIAGMIQRAYRKQDIVARFGGDEFMVFLLDPPSESKVKEKAESLLEETRAYFAQQYPKDDLSISIGIACSYEPVEAEVIFARADAALYQVKNNGKNGYQMDQGTRE